MIKRHLLSWDIETIPDYDLARTINPDLETASNDDVFEWLAQTANTNKNYPENKTVFLKAMFHKVVAISCAEWHMDDGLQLLRLGSHKHGEPADEKELLTDFFNALENPTAMQLISYNGKGFDSPVCFQRALHHNVSAKTLFENGGDAKYNNYINKYHSAHCDLLGVLGLESAFARNSLSNVLSLIGLPGKIGMGGASVEEAYSNGDHAAISDYCDMDAFLTLLVYFRYVSTVESFTVRTRMLADDILEFVDKNKDVGCFPQLLEQWDAQAWLKSQNQN